MQQTYTMPQVITANPNDWYVFFRFFHAGAWHPCKYRENLNRIKNLKERTKEAEALCEARSIWLKAGWNPVIDPKYKLRNLKTKAGKKQMLFNEAIDYGISKKTDLKEKSLRDYNSMLNFIKEIAVKTGHSILLISDMDRGNILDLLDECARVRKFSNHAYNKYATCLRSILTVCLNYRLIDLNPLRDLKEKEVPESNKYASFTEKEKESIAQHLLKVHPRLFVVMSVVYHTGIRPKEVLSLKIADIDLQNQRITIAPVRATSNSKTTNVRRVPINPHLYDLLNSMKLHTFPAHYFVFGSPLAPGKGSCGGGSQRNENGVWVTGAMRQDYFTPHIVEVSRDTVTKLWKKLIIDGLGLNKHLYAAKHTGTDDKVDAGMDLSDIQVLYGHKSEAMTARYNKRKRETDAREEILKKSPAFAPGKGLKIA